MKTREEIITEIRRRLAFKNSRSYGSYRSNHTFVVALFWVLGKDVKGYQDDANLLANLEKLLK